MPKISQLPPTSQLLCKKPAWQKQFNRILDELQSFERSVPSRLIFGSFCRSRPVETGWNRGLRLAGGALGEECPRLETMRSHLPESVNLAGQGLPCANTGPIDEPSALLAPAGLNDGESFPSDGWQQSRAGAGHGETDRQWKQSRAGSCSEGCLPIDLEAVRSRLEPAGPLLESGRDSVLIAGGPVVGAGTARGGDRLEETVLLVGDGAQRGEGEGTLAGAGAGGEAAAGGVQAAGGGGGQGGGLEVGVARGEAGRLDGAAARFSWLLERLSLLERGGPSRRSCGVSTAFCRRFYSYRFSSEAGRLDGVAARSSWLLDRLSLLEGRAGSPEPNTRCPSSSVREGRLF